MARALAQAGHHHQAKAAALQAQAAAQDITNPDRRAQVLAQIAEALIKARDNQSAARLAAAVCALGKWRIAARPVILLDPDALTTLRLGW